ncbi:MAG: Pyrophosphatase [Candidatus Nomurabacteria bacterium GW2011_GWF2_35_66]|uniref:Pyrophosphatase n=1 Tax=Candidatus Nomurabacteria bacterium GW2011_GWE1_35_16 TaxID=1618761 RepID=A0A0G0BBI4_9BACT|nr:MAG: Pyrophosphatase [Candidatus Nomurabacteria bacterium GW2011_GWF1_34_20]KKP63646.1 MAG: Pyrophosphatase [Candidatus Nomurabacteria bacterium GW2011_GWE2_34_25]KKP66848.1 MAG: Pyrophosphatase [Candidatus Nomurabacteria bacterium GW2011_GWE1_35_16]KKP83474.1 MAG: Pyrophosphatase [Candidatus Nomurabacteria bacterium GW2011_GWF2_35_66]HAE36594.1 nucleotide pyrophosphohydrolase [Candidatus Nomurabacteria bacterium]
MKKYEGEIRQYLEERNWHKLRPGDLAKSIAIESAELLELFQWTNQSLDEVKNDKEKMEQIKKELADVLTYCLDMSVLLEFDTGQIVLDKLEKIKLKYPAHLFKDRGEEIEPGSEEIYWKIKKEHRMKGE